MEIATWRASSPRCRKAAGLESIVGQLSYLHMTTLCTVLHALTLPGPGPMLTPFIDLYECVCVHKVCGLFFEMFSHLSQLDLHNGICVVASLAISKCSININHVFHDSFMVIRIARLSILYLNTLVLRVAFRNWVWSSPQQLPNFEDVVQFIWGMCFCGVCSLDRHLTSRLGITHRCMIKESSQITHTCTLACILHCALRSLAICNCFSSWKPKWNLSRIALKDSSRPNNLLKRMFILKGWLWLY